MGPMDSPDVMDRSTNFESRCGGRLQTPLHITFTNRFPFRVGNVLPCRQHETMRLRLTTSGILNVYW
jgi:hypothetical protein